MARAIPEGAYLKDVSAQYNHLTIPRRMRLFSPLPPETWGRVVVSDGSVDLYLEGEREQVRCLPDAPGIIPVDAAYRIENSGQPTRFRIEFYHEPKLKDGGELAGLLAATAAQRHRAKV